MFRKAGESKELPRPVARAEPALRRAYDVFFSKPSTNDGAHEALMALAVGHWKPKRVPEKVPLVHRQTLARIRNKVLRKLSDAELMVFRHQQGPEDLGIFLVIAPLLYSDPDLRKWYR